MEEEERDRVVRKKRANIKFIGQLFIQKVLSQQIMMTIIQDILRTERVAALTEAANSASSSGGSPPGPSPKEKTAAATELFVPSSIHIDVLVELLETIGRALDQPSSDCKKLLNYHFEKLKLLCDPAPPGSAREKYPAKFRFKLMNLVELRERDWNPRVVKSDTQAPTTLQEQEVKQAQKLQQGVALATMGAKSPVATPNSRGTARRFPPTPSFPDSPSANAGGSASTPSSSSNAQPGWRTLRAPQGRETHGYTPHSPASHIVGPTYDASVPLEKRVKDLRLTWNGESAVPGNWMLRFKTLEDAGTDDELFRSIVACVVREACTTTRKDAQLDASRFLLLGLEVDERLLFAGLTTCLAAAIEEGVMEDSPKFNERFVAVLHTTSNKDTAEELYGDTAKLLYTTFQTLATRDDEPMRLEEVLPLLEEVWRQLPVPGAAPAGLEGFVVQCVVDLRQEGEGQAEVAATLVRILLERKLATTETIVEWLNTRSAQMAPDVAQLVRQFLA
jgi:hypothetical protein